VLLPNTGGGKSTVHLRVPDSDVDVVGFAGGPEMLPTMAAVSAAYRGGSFLPGAPRFSPRKTQAASRAPHRLFVSPGRGAPRPGPPASRLSDAPYSTTASPGLH